MITRTIVGLAAVFAVAAASTVPALSESAKARAARLKQAQPQQYQYQQYPSFQTQVTPAPRRRSSNPEYDVYVNGRYAGSDPDPRIRAKLASDPPWVYDDN